MEGSGKSKGRKLLRSYFLKGRKEKEDDARRGKRMLHEKEGEGKAGTKNI